MGIKFEHCLRFSLCALCLGDKSILFILLRALCRREKTHLPWNQQLPDSFAKTPGVGDSYPFTTKHGFPITFSRRVPNPRVIRPCGALRRGHEPSVTPLPSGTATYERRPYASLCAARRTCRASPSLAHVLSFRLRFECFLWERLISRREPLQERTVDGKGCRTKGTTNP